MPIEVKPFLVQLEYVSLPNGLSIFFSFGYWCAITQVGGAPS